VNNGMKFTKSGPNVLATTQGKKPTQAWKYNFPTRIVYLTCYTNDPTGVQAGNTYAPGNDELFISEFYDLHDVFTINGLGNQNDPIEAQRVAVKRHGTGANVLFMDTHAALTPARQVSDPRLWDDGDYKLP
ncbi:MAG TPA: hypothetical protein VHC70_02950, partial [Phycisphaerales bacterium]|nr:hypothetical protein [Phycisphaerales bacterium]